MSNTSGLDNFIERVIELSGSGNYREIAQWNLEETIEMLSANEDYLNTALLTFNVKDHSLGVMYLLIAKFKTATRYTDEVLLTVHLKNFVTNCSVVQMRIALDIFYELCHIFTQFITHSLSWHQGIHILDTAIEKIRQNGSQLMPIHADLLELSLKAKYYKTAIKHLNLEVNAYYIIKEAANNKDLKYNLLYYLYGGLIYVAVKNYERALHFFEGVISNPESTSSLMDIMYEGYNKFILASLIVHGKIVELPEDVEEYVNIHFMARSEPYYNLANAYIAGSLMEFTAVATFYDIRFQLDDNIVLIKAVKLSLIKKDIMHILENSPSITFSDLKERLNLTSAEEAQEFIKALIESEDISATIDHTQGLVLTNSPIALPNSEYDDDIIF